MGNQPADRQGLEPLVGQLTKQRTPEGPYEAGPPSLSGTLTFPCCGETWTVTSDRITNVRCPDCGNLYVLALKFSINPPISAPYPKGVWMKVKKPFKAKVGAQEKQFGEGEKYRVGQDAYGVFAVPEGGIILEVPFPGLLGDRTLLAIAPIDNLELLEGTDAVRGTQGTTQDRSEDPGEEHLRAGGRQPDRLPDETGQDGGRDRPT